MDKTYTPRHAGRERISETGEYVPADVPRHRAFVPVAVSPVPAPWAGVR